MKYMTYEEKKELEKLAKEYNITECSIFFSAGLRQEGGVLKERKKKPKKAKATIPR